MEVRNNIMSNLDILNQLLAEDLIETICTIKGRRAARLKETGHDAKLKKIDLMDIPENAILIKLDNTREPLTLFKGDKGECKRCDYILFIEKNNDKKIIFIELKSFVLSNSDILKKFKSSQCLIDYCDSVLKRFFNKENLLSSYRKSFILFYHRSVRKNKSRQPISINKINVDGDYIRYANPESISINILL